MGVSVTLMKYLYDILVGKCVYMYVCNLCNLVNSFVKNLACNPI